MKNYFIKLSALLVMLVCVESAQAQFNLGNILGGVLGGKSSEKTTSESTKTSDLISGLTSIFSSEKQASQESIVGTWVYSEPAIVLSSDNFLTNAAAKLAAGKVEDKLSEVLSKYGIKAGALTITFNEDGTFTETIGTKKISGKWTITDSKLNLTFGKLASKTIPVTTQLENNKLMFVTDATKLLDFVKNIASKSTNSKIQTITSLMKSVNGMEAGLTLERK
jgi:hypothetical protein